MEGTEEGCFESDFPPGSDMMGDLILTYIMGRENSECLLLDTQCEHGICDVMAPIYPSCLPYLSSPTG